MQINIDYWAPNAYLRVGLFEGNNEGRWEVGAIVGRTGHTYISKRDEGDVVWGIPDGNLDGLPDKLLEKDGRDDIDGCGVLLGKFEIDGVCDNDGTCDILGNADAVGILEIDGLIDSKLV